MLVRSHRKHNLSWTPLGNIFLLFASHPCADIIRGHFRELEEQESEEEDDSDWDYDAH